ncbi:hypothetical protein EC973_007917 [Apophysomyces ossiformis]|uniref:C3H1-type domain-containing protein n=1 Tax=Apophysomyces ossiformis TaxID=679940 RepID=A0A8H7BP63_9FUNG|nr:hypothetical protein EC973_007917 [Apophysomyces ossiformis]
MLHSIYQTTVEFLDATLNDSQKQLLVAGLVVLITMAIGYFATKSGTSKVQDTTSARSIKKDTSAKQNPSVRSVKPRNVAPSTTKKDEKPATADKEADVENLSPAESVPVTEDFALQTELKQSEQASVTRDVTPVRSAEDVPVEPATLVTPLESTKVAKLTESVESVEILEIVESTKDVEPVECVEVKEATRTTDQAVESIVNTEAIKALQPKETEIVEPIEVVECTKSLETISSVAANEVVDPVGTIEHTTSVEPAQTVNPEVTAELVNVASSQTVKSGDPIQPTESEVQVEDPKPIEDTEPEPPTKTAELAESAELGQIAQASEKQVESVRSIQEDDSAFSIPSVTEAESSALGKEIAAEIVVNESLEATPDVKEPVEEESASACVTEQSQDSSVAPIAATLIGAAITTAASAVTVSVVESITETSAEDKALSEAVNSTDVVNLPVSENTSSNVQVIAQSGPIVSADDVQKKQQREETLIATEEAGNATKAADTLAEDQMSDITSETVAREETTIVAEVNVLSKNTVQETIVTYSEDNVQLDNDRVVNVMSVKCVEETVIEKSLVGAIEPVHSTSQESEVPEECANVVEEEQTAMSVTEKNEAEEADADAALKGITLDTINVVPSKTSSYSSQKSDASGVVTPPQRSSATNGYSWSKQQQGGLPMFQYGMPWPTPIYPPQTVNHYMPDNTIFTVAPEENRRGRYRLSRAEKIDQQRQSYLPPMKSRCEYWPHCTNKHCKFWHPFKECRAGDDCTFGKRCMFLHAKDLEEPRKKRQSHPPQNTQRPQAEIKDTA